MSALGMVPYPEPVLECEWQRHPSRAKDASQWQKRSHCGERENVRIYLVQDAVRIPLCEHHKNEAVGRGWKLKLAE